MKLLNNEWLSDFFSDNAIKKLSTIIITLELVILLLSLFSNTWMALLIAILFMIINYLLLSYSGKVKKELDNYISDLSYRIKRGEHEAIIKLPLGIVIYNDSYDVEWLSPYLQSASKDEESMIGRNVEELFPGIEKALEDNNGVNNIEWRDNYYRVRLEKELKTIYFENVTKYVKTKNKLEENSPVFGWLFLDNYDEVTKGLDDRAISNFNSLITTYLSNWARQHNIYYKKLENDKYLLLLKYNDLIRLEEEKFNIINNMREYTSKRNLPLTISIGLSYGEASFNELSTYAQKDLDLALGRGGDQAIVRETEKEPRYYGGTTNPMEKRTRVRSRMISEALQEQIIQAPTSYVMGHKYPDMDALGSSLGIARIAMMLEKDCKIIIDQDKIGEDIKKILKEIEKYPDSYKNIISPEEAEESIEENDLLVMVDHHKSSMSIAPSLHEKTNKLVIIDHHRRGDDFPEKPTLVYIEPYASSASELIVELFEYVTTDSNTINRVEATTLLGGIIVDTNNFTLRTGSRTFEAASYLQSVGANTITIQRSLKEEPENYLTRLKILESFSFIADGLALSYGEEEQQFTQVVAAQTADEMLSMTGVEASFTVVRLSDNEIGISARSLGQVNVQRIMEEMNGGGHLTNAATQIKDVTIEEAVDQLKEVVTDLNK